MKIKLQKEVLKHFREIYIQAKSELKDNVKKNRPFWLSALDHAANL
jgi:hypothetical protein